MPAVSGKVELKVDVRSDAPPGFVMYMPIYARESAHGNLQSRRAHLKGWVYASFHMSDFMASLYGTQQPDLSLAIYDGTELAPGALMYRSDTTTAGGGGTGSLHAREYMVVGGRNWTLSLNSLDGFDHLYGRSLASEIAVAGALLSAVLAFLTWLMIHGRARALRIAESMTEELRHMAQHDTLTGLPNRALFSDRLNQELEHARRHKGRFAMLFIDLDNFKPINDQYGHAIGDDVLIKAAQRLKSCVRAADSVGRIGGDEFVVLLAQLNEAEPVQALAEKMHRCLKNPIEVSGQKFSISSSIGVAVFPQDGADAAALTKSADEAMYRAKKAGRDCVRLSEANGDHHV
jgi:diguanylate cyclase (GGDEF)-like protein